MVVVTVGGGALGSTVVVTFCGATATVLGIATLAGVP